MQSSNDRNLLFGILAFQLALLSRVQLIAAMKTWIADKSLSLDEILERDFDVCGDRLSYLKALVEKYLDNNGNDVRQSLQSVSSVGTLIEDLASLGDPDIEATLTVIASDGPLGSSGLSSVSASGHEAGSGNRFKVLRLHAKGGLGEVFVARDKELNRDVALKEIQGRYASSVESRARFLLEAQVTGSLEHPGIVPVYGLGQYADGRPFYAMRFIQGDSLKEAIQGFHAKHTASIEFTSRETGFEFRQLLARFIDVCQAIEYAHSRGVLHRDLKPGNIMLGKYGETMVVDWGLAKVVESLEKPGQTRETIGESSGDSSHTEYGAIVGTPGFMSPEQAAGKLDELGPATDVYSLGATLYSLLTGVPPYVQSDSMNRLALLDLVRRGEFEYPRKIKPTVPRGLEAVCLKAMHLVPGERYASAQLLADDIERWLADEPVSVLPENFQMRNARWMRRHRGFMVAAIASLTVITLSTGLAAINIYAAKVKETAARESEAAQLKIARENERIAIANQQAAVAAQSVAESNRLAAIKAEENANQAKEHAEKEAIIADQARGLAEKSLQQANEAKTRLSRSLYVSDMILANLAWQSSRARTTKEILARYSDGIDPAVKGFEWHYLSQLANSEERILTGHEANIKSVAVSGNLLVSASLDKRVKVWDWTTGKEMKSYDLQSFVNRTAFSGDGKIFAAAADDGNLRLWNADSFSIVRTIKVSASPVTAIGFAPGDKLVATGSADGHVRIWEIETGESVLDVNGHTNPIEVVRFNKDGRQLASGGHDHKIKIWDAKDGKSLMELTGHANSVMGLVFFPSGNYIASASLDGSLKVWEVSNGKVVQTLQAHNDQVMSVDCNRRGDQLLSSCVDGTIKVFNMANGEVLNEFKGHTGMAYSAVFSDDDQFVLSGSQDATIRVWDVNRLSSPRKFAVQDARIADMQVSPDGNSIATCDGRQEVAIWDLMSGSLRRHLITKQQVQRICFSPDGGKLLAGSDNGTLTLIDVGSGKVRNSWRAHEVAVSGLCFSPRGDRIASTGKNIKEISIWNAAGGVELLKLSGGQGRTIAWSPDGQWIAAPNDNNEVAVWHMPSGVKQLSLRGHKTLVFAVTFSKDSKFLVSAGFDGTARIWEVSSGREVIAMEGHSRQVINVVFSPDGQRIATLSLDRTMKIWDVVSGRELMTIEGNYTNVQFDLTGHNLIATDANSILIWNGRPIASNISDEQ